MSRLSQSFVYTERSKRGHPNGEDDDIEQEIGRFHTSSFVLEAPSGDIPRREPLITDQSPSGPGSIENCITADCILSGKVPSNISPDIRS